MDRALIGKFVQPRPFSFGNVGLYGNATRNLTDVAVLRSKIRMEIFVESYGAAGIALKQNSAREGLDQIVRDGNYRFADASAPTVVMKCSANSRPQRKLPQAKVANRRWAAFRSAVSEPSTNCSSTGRRSVLAFSVSPREANDAARSIEVRNSHANAP